MHLSGDKTVGFVISPSGELQNVFNNGDVRGAGKAAIVAAVKLGAKTLDCYDGFLPDYYAHFGFVETSRMTFDDKYAPPNWNYANRRPDVVNMEWRGKDRNTVAEDYGTYTYKPTTKYE